jgi:small subunit ribosomal protein S6
MSTPSTHTYETIYILRPGVSEADAGTIHQKVDTVISKFEGQLKHRDDWGVKELAYDIDDESNGRYCVINYQGKSGVVEEIERHFKIIEDVMRYMTVMVPADYDYQKSKRQITASEEEMKKNRELRKKGQS